MSREQVEVALRRALADIERAQAAFANAPVAPEVPPRPDDVIARKEIRRRLLTVGAGEGQTDDFYTGWADCWDKVLDVLDVGRKPR